jgi:hypothetical protein
MRKIPLLERFEKVGWQIVIAVYSGWKSNCLLASGKVDWG